AVEQRHLAHELPGADPRDDLLDASGDPLHDRERAAPHEVHLGAALAFLGEDLTGTEPALAHPRGERGEIGVREARERPHGAEEFAGRGDVHQRAVLRSFFANVESSPRMRWSSARRALAATEPRLCMTVYGWSVHSLSTSPSFNR